MNSRKIAIVFIILGLGFIGFSSYKLTIGKEGNALNREYRSGYTIKTYNMEAKEQYYFPALKDNDFYCTLTNSFYSTCMGNNYLATSELVTHSYDFDTYVKNRIEAEKKIKILNTLEETKCIDKSKCYIVSSDSNSSSLYIFTDVDNGETIFTNYTFYDGSPNDYLDYILSNIKVTNDAKYTIGEEKDDKLYFHLKSDINDNPFAYIDLSLDKDKYTEVPNKRTDVDCASVKTTDGDRIDIYIAPNTYDLSKKKGRTYLAKENSSTKVFDIQYIDDNSDSEDEVMGQYTIYNKGDKTIYEKNETIDEHYVIVYGIENKSQDVMLVLRFYKERDNGLLDDFINFESKYNR